MRNLTTRGKVYYARFIVPKDRWLDVGKAMGSSTGKRRDVVLTLETRDHQQALQRRDAALETIRSSINAKLTEHGLPTLHGDWTPSWGNAHERMIEQALDFKKALADADDYRAPDYDEHSGHQLPDDFSERDFGADIVHENLYVTSQQLEAQIGGAEGKKAARIAFDQAHDIAFGNATPLGTLLDRWFGQIQGHVTNELIDRHHRAFKRLGQHLAEIAQIRTDDPEKYVRSIAIEAVNRRAVGHFREWLDRLDHIGPRVIASHLSTMSTFWTWAIDVGFATANPWQGSTRGLKKRAAKSAKARGEKRPYSDAELITLLDASRNLVERSTWGSAIHDAFRLGLLTGCRENEIASLTVDRVVRSEGDQSLWRITVTEDVGKTRAAVREIPLHPIARGIIERRLTALPSDCPAGAKLFPECKPGGLDMKAGHYLSKRFSALRIKALGQNNETDFHSTRRCFATFMKVAEANGVDACSDLVVDHLIGHAPMSLANNTYAAKRLDWAVYERAILGMVEKGIDEKIQGLLR